MASRKKIKLEPELSKHAVALKEKLRDAAGRASVNQRFTPGAIRALIDGGVAVWRGASGSRPARWVIPACALTEFFPFEGVKVTQQALVDVLPEFLGENATIVGKAQASNYSDSSEKAQLNLCFVEVGGPAEGGAVGVHVCGEIAAALHLCGPKPQTPPQRMEQQQQADQQQ